MRYVMCDVETSRIPEAISLPSGYDGAGVVLRNAGAPVGFVLCPSGRTGGVSTIGLREGPWHESLAPVRTKPDNTTLTIAICTRGRPVELGRCLDRLISLQDEGSDFEVVVVDNAPTDDRNLSVVSNYPTVRYLVERTPGLSVARNAAIRAATGEVIAFTDDDVVPDRNWVNGLRAALQENPAAAAFSGPVLPLELETEPQILLEGRGGLGHSFERGLFTSTMAGSWTYPCGAACFGAGANMAFRRITFERIGCFDEALGAGTPTRGGEDLDAFYRVVRAGLTWAYEPRMLVFHQHRRDMEGLRAQVESWGRGNVAYLLKSFRSDPGNRYKILACLLEMMMRKAGGLVFSLVRARAYPWPVSLAWSEFTGMFAGFGAYARAIKSARGRRSTPIADTI